MIQPGLETIAQPATRGERVTIVGRVFDGDRVPVANALIEVWQANADGRYDHPDDTQEKLLDVHFHGFGRAVTDGDGGYRFHTIKPGPVPGADARLQAPHLNVTIFGRGLLKHLFTRIYFPDDPLNATDTVLRNVPRTRRATLIATTSPRSANAAVVTAPAVEPPPITTLRFDIVLQGDGETVFFEF